MTITNSMQPIYLPLIYLPDVESNAQPSPYADLIQSAQANGAEFNFYNRCISSTGVHPASWENHQAYAAKIAQKCCVRS